MLACSTDYLWGFLYHNYIVTGRLKYNRIKRGLCSIINTQAYQSLQVDNSNKPAFLCPFINFSSLFIFVKSR